MSEEKVRQNAPTRLNHRPARPPRLTLPIARLCVITSPDVAAGHRQPDDCDKIGQSHWNPYTPVAEHEQEHHGDREDTAIARLNGGAIDATTSLRMYSSAVRTRQQFTGLNVSGLCHHCRKR